VPAAGTGVNAPHAGPATAANPSTNTHMNQLGLRTPVPHPQNLPGPAPNTAGPHRYDLLNKLDPRVDSDMSNPRTVAAFAVTDPSTGPAPNTAGPHRSDLLNKLDPRVDSDLSAMRREGFKEQAVPYSSENGAGASARAPEGMYGPHSSRFANAADPRVNREAGVTGCAEHHGMHATGGPNQAIDPRVTRSHGVPPKGPGMY
jgi:hypothetical protein